MEYVVIIICISILIFMIGSFLASVLLCRYYARPKRRTHEDEKNRFRKIGLLYEYDDNPKYDEFTLTLRDKVEINGRIFMFNPSSLKFVILAHGFTASQVSMSKYMQAYKEEGYNIITYDERGHSENKKAICGMSYFEAKDLTEVVEFVYKKFGDDIYLGVHGESMGAASVVGSLKYNPNIKFAVADCPFARLKDISINEGHVKHHAPMFVINMCGLVGKIFFGYNPNEVNSIDGINNSKVPLLLCHGLNDNLIPYSQSQEIYDLYQGPKDIYFTEGADHAQSIYINRDGYNKKIKSFLKSLEK